MKYIGIDIGSTYIKAILFDTARKEVLYRKKIPFPRRIPNSDPRIFEVDAKRIAEDVKELVNSFTSEGCGAIDGLFFDTQMHGFVYSTNGTADRYVSWRDSRCLNKVPGKDYTWLDEIKRTVPSEAMKRTGTIIKPSLGICNLYTMLHTRDISSNGILYTIGSYIIYLLTGRNVAHLSNLAPVGVLDITRKELNSDVINALDLYDISFPELATEDFEPCGWSTLNGQKIKIFPDYGDMQISVLGARPKKFEAVFNIATAGQIIVPTDQIIEGEYEVRPYFEGRYLNTVSNMPSGKNLAVIEHFLKDVVQHITKATIEDEIIWKVINKMPVKDSCGLLVDPIFIETPYHMEPGSISGINETNLSLQNLVASTVSSIADIYLKYLYGMENENSPIKKIVCAGGVSWSMQELVKIIGEKSRIPCRLSPVEDESAAGLCRLALYYEREIELLEEPVAILFPEGKILC